MFKLKTTKKIKMKTSLNAADFVAVTLIAIAVVLIVPKVMEKIKSKVAPGA